MFSKRVNRKSQMTATSSYLRHMFAIAFLFCLCSFSYASIGDPEKILFSPDSSKIAFMWSENFYKFALIPVDTPLLKKEIYIYCWLFLCCISL